VAEVKAPAARTVILVAIFVLTAIVVTAVAMRHRPVDAASVQTGAVMLILRGIASADQPRGQLDDASALEYAQRHGYRGEVLDVAGNTGAGNRQVRMALDRIRRDDTVTALYGFSGGGYNARQIWRQLNAAERERIDKVIVVGSPGVGEGDFPGSDEVIVERDPPEGHMAGPKVLLESVDSEASQPAKPSGETVGRGN
jgi:hypothetical protein